MNKGISLSLYDFIILGKKILFIEFGISNDKVLNKDRDLWPIVIDSGGTIVWLPGLKKSKFDKTKNEKYDIILRYY